MGLINVRDPLNVIPICLNIHSLTSITKAQECQAWYFCNPLSYFRPQFNYIKLQSYGSLFVSLTLGGILAQLSYLLGDSRESRVNKMGDFDCNLNLLTNPRESSCTCISSGWAVLDQKMYSNVLFSLKTRILIFNLLVILHKNIE